MEGCLWLCRWRVVGACLVACGCANMELVEPEYDLAREHRDEIAELRHEAIRFCGDGRGGVSDTEIRVNKTTQGVRISMEATCVDENAHIYCDRVVGGLAEMTCEAFN